MKSVQDVTRAIENMRKTEEDQIKQRKRQASRAKAQGMEVPKNVKLDDIPMPAFGTSFAYMLRGPIGVVPPVSDLTFG